MSRLVQAHHRAQALGASLLIRQLLLDASQLALALGGLALSLQLDRVALHADGVEHAAVYVPTTPNPTGGYLEIVPVTELVATDWSVDQEMAFILSVGATSPDTLPFAINRKS